MAMRYSYEKQEDVPEALRDHYVEKDGKWVIDAEGLPAFQNPSVLRDLAGERKKRQELEKKIEKWEALGKSDEEIATLLAAEAEREQSNLEQKGQWEKLRAQLLETHKGESEKAKKLISERDATISALKQAIQDMLVENTAAQAIAEHNGDPELLMPFIRKQVRVTEVEGKNKLEVIGADGVQRMNKDANPLSVSDLVAEMRGNERFGRLFKSSGSSGGGAPPANGGGGGSGHQYKRKADFKSEKERAEFVEAQGLDAYKALPA